MRVVYHIKRDVCVSRWKVAVLISETHRPKNLDCVFNESLVLLQIFFKGAITWYLVLNQAHFHNLIMRHTLIGRTSDRGGGNSKTTIYSSSMAHGNDRSDRASVYRIHPYMFEPESVWEQDTSPAEAVEEPLATPVTKMNC